MNYSAIIRDLYFGIAGFCFAVCFGMATMLTVIVENDGSAISGQAFPYIVTAIMVLLSLALIVNKINELRKIKAADRVYLPMLSKDESKRISIFILSLVVYILGFIYIGYIVSTTIYLLCMLLFMRASNKVAVAILTLTVPGIMWYFFVVMLEVQLPEALLI